jgi:hypothetical protein
VKWALAALEYCLYMWRAGQIPRSRPGESCLFTLSPHPGVDIYLIRISTIMEDAIHGCGYSEPEISTVYE